MRTLAAMFDTPEALTRAAEKLKNEGFPPEDALTPFHVEALDDSLGLGNRLIRRYMAAAGFSVAAFMFALQIYSAAIGYPINSGGRPYFSWQVFGLVPFEAGVLAAGLAGFISLLFFCGFPALHHPLFELKGVERATSDRFFLILKAPGEGTEARLRDALAAQGAISVEEVPA